MRSYETYLQSAGVDPAPVRVQCTCGRVVRPANLLDVSGVDEGFRGAQVWACDAETSRWVREKRLTQADLDQALAAAG